MLYLSSEQEAGFHRLDRSLQELAVLFRQGISSVEDLVKDLAFCMGDRLLEQLREERQQEMQDRKEQELRDRFLERLRFEDMYVRMDSVKDAHEETFQWIFDQSKQDAKWSNFGEWLEKGSGTFWINGKAGSGKSTLMNYIIQNSETADLLTKWAGSKSLVQPSFFFWASGSQLQRSVEGLLRSLAYQILKVHPGLIPLMIRQNSGSADTENAPRWTEKRLRQCVKALVGEVSKTHRICLFLDGLDEFAGDHDDLLYFVEQLVEDTEIKCCFSSRPERAFEDFTPSETLRLQDLTDSDIKKYIDDNLGLLPQIHKLPSEKQEERKNLWNEIAEKADGVFLWVELAVKSQIWGIKNRDPFEILRERLLSLPSDINDLYSQMLERIDRVYWEEVAWYLKATLHMNDRDFIWCPASIYRFAIARFGIDADLHISNGLSSSNIRSRCSDISEWINLRCAGLLDVRKHHVRGFQDPDAEECAPNGRDSSRYPPWRLIDSSPEHAGTDWTESLVVIFHRTVGDYLKSHPKGQEFLNHDHSFPAYARLLDTAISVVEITLLSDRDVTNFFGKAVTRTFQLAAYFHPANEEILQMSVA